LTPARPERPKSRAWARVVQAAAIVLVAAAGHGSSLAESRTAPIEAKDIGFKPPRLTVHVGDTVTWRNDDFVAHTATSKEAGFDVELAPGKEGAATVSKPGTFAYICRYHPNMRGTLVVEP
jgi:plastocyanin